MRRWRGTLASYLIRALIGSLVGSGVCWPAVAAGCGAPFMSGPGRSVIRLCVNHNQADGAGRCDCHLVTRRRAASLSFLSLVLTATWIPRRHRTTTTHHPPHHHTTAVHRTTLHPTPPHHLTTTCHCTIPFTTTTHPPPRTTPYSASLHNAPQHMPPHYTAHYTPHYTTHYTPQYTPHYTTYHTPHHAKLSQTNISTTACTTTPHITTQCTTHMASRRKTLDFTLTSHPQVRFV